jgi:hypothetical protein
MDLVDVSDLFKNYLRVRRPVIPKDSKNNEVALIECLRKNFIDTIIPCQTVKNVQNIFRKSVVI